MGQGLKTFGIDLKVASKFFGQKFACGASITGDDEIVIQGDFKDDLFDLIPEKWSEVDEDLIEDLAQRRELSINYFLFVILTFYCPIRICIKKYLPTAKKK